MEHDANVFGAKVPEGRGVPGDALADMILSTLADTFGADALSAFADAKGKPVGSAVIVVMAGAARDVPVAAQNLVVEKQLTELGLIGVEFDKVVIRQRSWQIGGSGGKRETESEDMEQLFHALIFAGCAVLATPVFAEIEEARDLMEAGRFEEAREALLPAARSGNADAEELIGVMYALGLGVERDPERAFEWYLRSSMKGHPGAQSGVGWYYEVGIGMPAPDLVRAYLWYALSTIGGDPDAAISLEEVVKKMTPEEIARAQVLIDDYKPWMYPFR